ESGQALAVTAVTQGAHGRVSFRGGPVTYTPAADYNGTDSFTYTITDNGTTNGGSNPGRPTGTESVRVTEGNYRPTEANEPSTSAEDGSVTLEPRANDSAGPGNESGQALAVTAVTQGAHGTVSFSGGSVTYTPAADYNGTDSFTYTITDNGTTNGVS